MIKLILTIVAKHNELQWRAWETRPARILGLTIAVLVALA